MPMCIPNIILIPNLLIIFIFNTVFTKETNKCVSDCNEVTNICVLLNFTGETRHLNRKGTFNDFRSDILADQYFEDNQGAVFCTNYITFEVMNNTCWILTPLFHEDSFNSLVHLLTKYAPEIKDPSVDILDLLNTTNSPCFTGRKMICPMNRTFSNIGIISLQNSISKNRLSDPNFFFDGAYSSPYFMTNESFMCILDSSLYSILKCLERTDDSYKTYVPKLSNSDQLNPKLFPPRNEKKTFYCLPTVPIYHHRPPKFPFPRVMLCLILNSISLGFLLIHIIGSLTCENGTDYPRIIFLFFAISLGLEMSTVMIQIVLEAPIEICVLVYFIQRFGALSAFSWMGIIGFDLWCKFKSSESLHASLSKWEKRRRIIKYSCFAWGLPLFFVTVDIIVSFVSDENSKFHHHYIAPSCLMWKDFPSYVFYRIPMILILISNIYFFLATTLTIRKTKEMVTTQMKDSHNNKLNYFAIFWKMAALMGIHWIISIIAWITDNEILHYIDIVLTSLQNVFLFLFFTAKHCLNRTKMVGVKFCLPSIYSHPSTINEDEVTSDTKIK